MRCKRCIFEEMKIRCVCKKKIEGVYFLKKLMTVSHESANPTIGLLICTLISENQGLEKSRSDSNLRNISGPANLDFFRSRFIPET